MSETVIKTIGLTRHYRNPNGGFFNAVDNLNLEIVKGEVFAFLGPNGAGKTTTMKMLLGLTFQTSGDFTICDGSIKDRRIRAKIGYLPEESTMYPFLRVEDVLRFYARLFGQTRRWRKSRVDNVIEFTGLADKRRELIKNLSKGLRQRVGIAQSLVNDPELIFFDEPASGLDPIGIQNLRDLMSKLKESGKTIFLNSHQLSEVELVADRVGMIKNGKLLKIGEIKKLLGSKGGTEIGIMDISPEKIVNAIKAKIDVGEDSWRIRTGDEGVIIEVDSDEHSDAIISALMAGGIRIYLLRKRTRSLESLFTEVMGEKEF